MSSLTSILCLDNRTTRFDTSTKTVFSAEEEKFSRISQIDLYLAKFNSHEKYFFPEFVKLNFHEKISSIREITSLRKNIYFSCSLVFAILNDVVDILLFLIKL